MQIMKSNLNLKKIFKSLMVFSIAVIAMSYASSYGNSNVNNLSVSESLAKAKKNGNSVFLVITGAGDTLHEKAMEMAKSANKLEKNSVVLELDKDDSTNKELITLYNLSNAPLPLILIFSPNGLLVYGYLYSQATPELLVQAIPSPKRDDILLALTNQKSVFIVVTKKSYIDQYDVIASCDSAIAKMNNKAELVKIDLDDSKETALLEMLKVDASSSKTATVVLNPKGVINATYYELTNAAALITAATKVASSCCPSSSNKSCGPK